MESDLMSLKAHHLNRVLENVNIHGEDLSLVSKWARAGSPLSQVLPCMVGATMYSNSWEVE